MKLSYRDKVIFICAIVAIILVAGFFLFIKPKYDEMTVAKSYLEDKEDEKAKIEERINTLTNLVDQVKEVAKSIEEPQKRFFDYQAPYLNEQAVYELIEANNVEVRAMTTNYIAPQTIEGYVTNTKNIMVYDLLAQGDIYNELPQEVLDEINKLPDNLGEQFIVGVTNIELSYKDDQELSNVMSLLDAISEDERTIRVMTFSNQIEKDSAEPEKDGGMSLEMYHIYPLNIEKVMEETDEVEIVPVAEAAAE